MENCCKIDNKSCIAVFLTILGIFLVALIISTGLDIQSKMQETENSITVSDTGTIYAKPDLAVATASVISEDVTVAAALSANAKKMNAVIAAVKAEGVEENDLKTTSFNISPRYEWRDQTYYYSGERVLVGYEVTQSLEIKIRDLEKVGAIIQKATDEGANEISNLQFTIDEQDELKKQAREQAIAKAKSKAEELAKELGLRLVEISSFSETGVTPYYYGLEKASSAIGMGGEAAPEIQTGENKIEVTVYITYKIK